MLEKLRPYWQALPDIFTYQILTKPIIGFWIFLLGLITQELLTSTGRVAVTSGDFGFLFKTWQGYLIMLIGIVSLFIYIAFDLNTKIVLSRKLVTGEEISIWRSMDEGFRSLRGLLSLRGLITCLYIALIAPLLGLGVSTTLTRGFYIPTFITSVISDSPLFSILLTLAMLVFLSVGIADLFVLHGITLDRMSAKEAAVQSGQLMHEHWKNYLKENLLFAFVMIVVLGIIVMVGLVLPLMVIQVLPVAEGVRRFLLILFVLAGCIISALACLTTTPIYFMKMTQLFYTYKNGEKQEYARRESKKHPLAVPGIALVVAILVAASIGIDRNFDTMFPQGSDVEIIAHRAGGNEGAENTVEGLRTAAALGAYGSEIDIQRTKDGAYILLHDGDFKRVAGDDRKPEEMTLEEIRKLSVDGEPIPTFEEALSACKGRLVLFTELKGKTADRKMAEDAVKIIRKYGMEKECVLVSLKYDLIDYIETRDPDIQTGFLLFTAFGNTAKLNCDYLGMEEESATEKTISSVHKQNKKMLVWTVNERGSQKHFLCTEADGIITDEVRQAGEIRQKLENRTDLQRMIDWIKAVVS